MRGTQWEAKTETEFHQRTEDGKPDEYRKGKPIRQTVTSYEGHTRVTEYVWNEGYATLGGGKFPALDSVTTTVTDQGPGGPFTYSQTTRNVYDLNGDNLEIQTLNLLEEHKNELCSTCPSDEEIQTVMEYGTKDWTKWILDKPTKVTVTKYVEHPPDPPVPHRVQSRKWMDYDSYGNLIKEEVCKSDTPATGCEIRNSDPLTGPNPVTQYFYDPVYRVLTQVIDPGGYLATVSYDPTKTHVYETTKCADLECTNQHKTTTEYDPGTGKLVKLVPPHLQGTSYWLQTQYDALGRKTLERMKDNADPNTEPLVNRGKTIYEYYFSDDANTQYVKKRGVITVVVPTSEHPSPPPQCSGLPECTLDSRTLILDGYTYFDGMGRTYLAKADGPAGKMICMETEFDPLVAGRVWKQSNPYFCGLETPNYTVSTYDGLSRMTMVEKPDKPPERPDGPGYRIVTTYQGLTRIVSREYGNDLWQSTAYTYDCNQRLVRVGEGLGVSGQETYTEYLYDVLGNLVRVDAAKDALGYDIYSSPIFTTMNYDSL